MSKLPNNASKETLKAAHRHKMMGKHFRNKEWGSTLSETPEQRKVRETYQSLYHVREYRLKQKEK